MADRRESTLKDGKREFVKEMDKIKGCLHSRYDKRTSCTSDLKPVLETLHMNYGKLCNSLISDGVEVLDAMQLEIENAEGMMALVNTLLEEYNSMKKK